MHLPPLRNCLHNTFACNSSESMSTSIGMPRMPVAGASPGMQPVPRPEQLSIGERVLIGATPVLTVGSLIGLGYPPYSALLRWRICTYMLTSIQLYAPLVAPGLRRSPNGLVQHTTQKMRRARLRTGRSSRRSSRRKASKDCTRASLPRDSDLLPPHIC